MMLFVRHGRIAVDAVGYDVVQLVRLVVADPPRCQVAVDPPVRSVIVEAVAARAAGLSDATHEPLLGYEVGGDDGPVGLLVLLLVILHLPSHDLCSIPFCFGVFVVVVEVDLLDVRRFGDCSLEPLPGGVRELVVEDGDGILDGVALEGVAGPAVVMHEVLLDQADGERHGVAQRYHLPLHRRLFVFVVHVADLLLPLEPRSAYKRLP